MTSTLSKVRSTRPPEPISSTTPRPVRRPLLSLRLSDVAFVHWAVEPSAVEALLPAGVEPDTFAGSTYVGLVALRTSQAGPLRSPGLPYLGSFLQTNVRLYSVDRLGRRGVVFRSMDVNRLVPALAGRATGLPYHWSRMTAEADGSRWTYVSGRRDVGSALTVEVGDAVAPAPLEDFLTARWGLHVRRAGRLWHVAIDHPPWPMRAARVLSWHGNLVAAAGVRLAPHQVPASVLWSPGVPAHLGAP